MTVALYDEWPPAGKAPLAVLDLTVTAYDSVQVELVRGKEDAMFLVRNTNPDDRDSPLQLDDAGRPVAVLDGKPSASVRRAVERMVARNEKGDAEHRRRGLDKAPPTDAQLTGTP